MKDLIGPYILKLMNESTPEKPAWNIEVQRGNKAPIWNYIDGCMMNSLLDLYEETKDKKYFDFVDNYIDYYVFDDGSIRGFKIEDYNLDSLNEGRVLVRLYHLTKKEKYLLGIKTLFKQIENQPRTIEGNFWHKKIYPYQVWLDGLYMAQPFYLMCDLELNNGAHIKDIINQFKNVYSIMFDKEKHLYYHGYDSSRTAFWADKVTGLSKNFWLRSIGWYLTALVDIYSLLPEKYVDEKKIIKSIINTSLDGIFEYQDKDSSMFYQVPNYPGREGNYLETSGSAMISYASMKASRLGVCDKKYSEKGKEIFEGICNKYLCEKDGNLELGGICLVAGLGPEKNKRRDGSYEYYISEPIVKNDAKGVGPLIMAYTELIKIKTR